MVWPNCPHKGNHTVQKACSASANTSAAEKNTWIHFGGEEEKRMLLFKSRKCCIIS